MQMIRKFELNNALGQTYNLNDSNKSFFHDIKGLGQEHKVTYVQLGTRFIKEKDLLSQKNIQGTIFFKTYEEYQNFSNFIQHKPLTLIYKSADTYSISVSIDKLEKSERGTGGLYCRISFKSLGTFYKNVIIENMHDTSMIGKTYPSTYPYTYKDRTNGIIEIESDSILESPTRINIFGPYTNPSYTQYLNGKLLRNGKINVTIPEGNKLVIDTTQIPYSIQEYTIDNVFVENLYDKSDFETERFILLQYGKNKLSFVHEASEALRISVEARIEYESV